MSDTDPTPAPTRNPRRKIEVEETQAALGLLVDSMGEDRISPMAAINGSATGLLATMLGIADGRAAYILSLLVESGAVARIEKSHKVLVTRATVRLEAPPALSDSDKERYEATIRRLAALLQAEEGKVAQLTTEVGDLRAQLADLTKTDGPSADVLQIMQEVGAV